jgi:hypothetical protein
MDTTVSARYFRVSGQPEKAADFPDLLLGEMAKPLTDRERDVTATGVILRVEHCQAEATFVSGQFCRKQTENIPPQAGPAGLAPMNLPAGQGLGHLAAFLYHRPTRVFLLQNNMQCATPHRVSLYLMMINGNALYKFVPVFRQDAMERFKDRKVRSFTVRFASPENLDALDDAGIASARGARMLAEAFHGLDLEITIGVGKRRKSFLDFASVKRDIEAILGSAAKVKKLEVSGTEDELGPDIDFLQEQLKCKEKLALDDQDYQKNYQVRKVFLQEQFNGNLDYLNTHFAPKDGHAH